MSRSPLRRCWIKERCAVRDAAAPACARARRLATKATAAQRPAPAPGGGGWKKGPQPPTAPPPPASAPHPPGDPDQEGPTASAQLRPRGLPLTQQSRAADQPPQAGPARRYAL